MYLKEQYISKTIDRRGKLAYIEVKVYLTGYSILGKSKMLKKRIDYSDSTIE